MQDLERDLRQEDYIGLTAREAKLRERHDAHVRRLEEDSLLQLARQKLDDEQESRHTRRSTVALDPVVAAAHSEIAELESDVHITAVASTIMVEMRVTDYRALTAKLHFQPSYPAEGLTLELVSRRLAPGLLEKLASSAAAIVAKRRGTPHAAAVVQHVHRVLKSNQLGAAYVDIVAIREMLSADKGHGRIQHARQASGELIIELIEGAYRTEVHAQVPAGYPADPAEVTVSWHNLPADLVAIAAAKAADISARLARFERGGEKEPDDASAWTEGSPARGETSRKYEQLARAGKQTMTSYNLGQHLADAAREHATAARRRRAAAAAAFEPQPGLFAAVRHLLDTCVRPLAHGSCPVCKKRLLPSDPNNLTRVPPTSQVIQVYCGHYYHFKCVETFLTEPPFGKCCHSCGALIAHQQLTTDTKVLEARWASKQAKQRELDDIATFLG